MTEFCEFNKAITLPVMTWKTGEDFASFIESLEDTVVDVVSDTYVEGVGFDMFTTHLNAEESLKECGNAISIGSWCAMTLPYDERIATLPVDAAQRFLGISREAALELCEPDIATLFGATEDDDCDDGFFRYEDYVTPQLAAKAIRNTLLHGDPNWKAIFVEDWASPDLTPT